MLDLRKQYNNFATQFAVSQETKNQLNRQLMYKFVGNDLTGKKILDVGCGDGIDVAYYGSLGADATGLDSSEELIEIARKKYPNNVFDNGFAENMPYQDNSFDCVFSKYAIMTSADLKPIFNEIYRVLKPDGRFVYLATHPFRQYLELNDLNLDYFAQRNVDLNCLDNTVIITEPTQTLNSYFYKDFFSKFDIINYLESKDPAADPKYRDVIPGFFLVECRKR